MSSYNDIGIDNTLDWQRIRKLMIIGLLAGCTVMIGDMLLGWGVHSYAQIAAFAKGKTPYPKWCCIFCMPVGQAITMLLKFTPETALRNALTAGWLSIANIWMMGGLLIMMNRAKGGQGS